MHRGIEKAPNDVTQDSDTNNRYLIPFGWARSIAPIGKENKQL
jgi:hypothetical protein